jgi:hypothetical protein
LSWDVDGLNHDVLLAVVVVTVTVAVAVVVVGVAVVVMAILDAIIGRI